eukprot:4832564-Alexandrium_andersonii.AAC.1
MDPPLRELVLAPMQTIPMAVGYSNGCRAFRSQKMRNRLRRSTLKPRGPKSGLKMGPRSSRP